MPIPAIVWLLGGGYALSRVRTPARRGRALREIARPAKNSDAAVRAVVRTPSIPDAAPPIADPASEPDHERPVE